MDELVQLNYDAMKLYLVANLDVCRRCHRPRRPLALLLREAGRAHMGMLLKQHSDYDTLMCCPECLENGVGAVFNK